MQEWIPFQFPWKTTLKNTQAIKCVRAKFVVTGELAVLKHWKGSSSRKYSDTYHLSHIFVSYQCRLSLFYSWCHLAAVDGVIRPHVLHFISVKKKHELEMMWISSHACVANRRLKKHSIVITGLDAVPNRKHQTVDFPWVPNPSSSSRVETVDCGDEAASWLSGFLGQPCRLIRQNPDFTRDMKKRPDGGTFKGTFSSLPGFELFMLLHGKHKGTYLNNATLCSGRCYAVTTLNSLLLVTSKLFFPLVEGVRLFCKTGHEILNFRLRSSDTVICTRDFQPGTSPLWKSA